MTAMDEDDKTECTGSLSLVWKEPVNGKTAFFTEEVYQQLAGPELSLEEHVTNMMDTLGYPPPTRMSKRRQSDRHDRSFNRWCPPDSFPRQPDGDAEQKIMSKENATVGISMSSDKVQGATNMVGTGPHPKQDDPPLVTLTSGSEASSVSSGTPTSIVCHDSEMSETIPAQADSGMKFQGSQNKSFTHSAGESTGLSLRSSSVANPAGQQYQALRGKGGHASKRPAAPETRKSSLSHEQHIRYLDLFKKCTQKFFSGFTQPPSQRDLEELKEFEALQMMVAKEQEECQAYLKQMALHNPYLYTYMVPHISKYTQDREQYNWKRAETYCRYYNPHSQLPLSMTIPPSMPAASLPALTLVQTVLEVGSKCRLVMPDNNPNPNARLKRTVSTELQKIAPRFPPTNASNDQCWNHEPASMDKNFEKLVQKYPCHIATTASVLQQLIDNHAPDFNTAWDIPVIVKVYGDKSASRKVVFLDKPLLPHGLSQCQKKTQYLQKAVRTFLCQPHNERGRGKNVRGQPTEGEVHQQWVPRATADNRAANDNNQDEDPFGASVSMDHLETFGSDKHTQSDKKPPSAKLSAPDKGGGDLAGRKDSGKIRPIFENFVRADRPFLLDNASDTKPCEIQNKTGAKDVSESNAVLETQLNLTIKIEEAAEHLLPDTGESRMVAPVENSDNKKVTSTSPTRRCSRSSIVHSQTETSDDDDDALVIAVPDSPSQSPQKVSNMPDSSSKKSQETNDGESGVERQQKYSTSVSAYPIGPNPAEEIPPRRLTRSASLRLQSLETENKTDPKSQVCHPKASKSEQSGSCITDDSDVISHNLLSVRVTRQTLKRRMSSQESSGQEIESAQTLDNVCNPNETQQQLEVSGNTPTESRMEIDGPKKGTCLQETDGHGHITSSAQLHASSNDEPEMQKPCMEAESSTYLDSILKEMNTTGEHSHAKMQENSTQYRQPGCLGENVGYHLWDLSGVGVLVRCNSHSFVRNMRQQQMAVYVTAKPERQVNHGLEQSTLSECVRGWMGCYMRPNSYLLRGTQDVLTKAAVRRRLSKDPKSFSVIGWSAQQARSLLSGSARINMQNYEMVHTEELQLNQILQPTFNFSPQCAFAVLRNIFSVLISLQEGSYLLSHESGADHIQLKAGTNSRRGSYDLRSHYMGLIMKEADKTVAWVPVDPTLMLPHHWRMGLIPVTFQPADFDPKRKKQQQFVPPKKKKKFKKKNLK